MYTNLFIFWGHVGCSQHFGSAFQKNGYYKFTSINLLAFLLQLMVLNRSAIKRLNLLYNPATPTENRIQNNWTKQHIEIGVKASLILIEDNNLNEINWQYLRSIFNAVKNFNQNEPNKLQLIIPPKAFSLVFRENNLNELI